MFSTTICHLTFLEIMEDKAKVYSSFRIIEFPDISDSKVTIYMYVISMIYV